MLIDINGYMENEDELFCICRTKYDGRLFMIECYACKDWFHGKCIGITELEADQIEEYYCSACQIKHDHQVKLKIFTSQRSYKPEDFELIEHESVKNFYQALDDRKFLDSSQVVTYIATGSVLNPEFVYDNRFQKPIVIGKPDGLGLNVPNVQSSKHLEVFLGSNFPVNIHDVLENEERTAKLFEWTDHFDNDDNTLENVSIVHQLDITSTKLFKLIKPPKIFKQIDIIDMSWPKSDSNEDFLFECPKASLFLSIGDATSFTDFSVGMAGSTTWYYNIVGSKTYYLVPPTDDNLKIFENRGKINNLDRRFFGDVVDACYKLQTRERETIIIPGGWMSASYVNEKSICLVGEIFDIFNVPSQIGCYEMQKRLKSLNTIRFPHFEALVWCATETILQILVSSVLKYSKQGIVNTAKALIPILRKWISKKEEHLHAQEIPPHINPSKLINSLSSGIAKFNRSLNQLVSPLKIRTPKPSTSKVLKSPSEANRDEPDVKDTKISIKLNKSLLFNTSAIQNDSGEANVLKFPIKLRLPKNVLTEMSPLKEPETPKVSKSGRRRKRPKMLSGFVDPVNSSEITPVKEVPKSAPASLKQERSDLTKIRERLQSMSSKQEKHIPNYSDITPDEPTTPLASTRKRRQVYNEDSPDERDSEGYLQGCKQDSFYIYPTIDTTPITKEENLDETNKDPLKLTVKLPLAVSTPPPLPATPQMPRKVPLQPGSKVKKGLSTPKQRLGKLLKIDRSYIRR